MIYSLRDLRTELSIELRNESGDGARYTELEMNVALRRATNILREHFWHTEMDESKQFVAGQLDYVYDFPVSKFEKVAFRAGNSGVYQFSEEWYEPIDGTLTFLSEHGSGDTIYVWYQRHPFPYPDDLVLSGTINSSVTQLTVGTDVPISSWPTTGYFKLNNELFRYTEYDPSTRMITFERGLFNTASVGHAAASKLSFVNLIDKPVFFEGVKDLAMAYLNRMRIVDIPAADAQGNVTIMREILDGYQRWISRHRQRSSIQPFAKSNISEGLRGRRRGR